MVFLPKSEDSKTDGLEQKRRLGALIYGARATEHWDLNVESVDFYDLKAVVENMVSLSASAALSFEQDSSSKMLHPGQAAKILVNDKEAGKIGTVHPMIQKALGLDAPAILFEIDSEALLQSKVPQYSSVSKFPSVSRDIALVVDKNIASGDLIRVARECSSGRLESARIFDIYEGQGIDSNKKSVGIRLTFRDYSRTLNDEEITSIVHELLESAKSEFGAIQR